MHEWRKSVKTLWYQMRLVEPAAPSAIAPVIATLDRLGEALGDDHDLAVLVGRLAADPHRYGGALHAMRAIEIARAEQAVLRGPAFRIGATIYAELLNVLDEDGKDIVYWYEAYVDGLDPPGLSSEDIDCSVTNCRMSRVEEPRTMRLGVKFEF